MLIWVCSSQAAFAAPDATAGNRSVCLYESRAYSVGAYLCIQKSLMQVCGSDGTQASWKPVSDKEISDRCAAPMTSHSPAARRSHGFRRHVILHRPEPVAERSAKCFMFNGRQYCE